MPFSPPLETEEPVKQRTNRPERRSLARPGNRVSWFLVSSVLGFAPLAFGAVEFWSIAIVEVLSYLAALAWVIGGVRRQVIRIELSVLIFAPAALIAWIGIQILLGLTVDPDATKEGLLLLTAYFAVFLVVINEDWSEAYILRTGLYMATLGFAIALFGIIQASTWNGKIYWVREIALGTPFGPYVNHNHFAGLMEMLAPFTFGLALSKNLDNLWRALLAFFVLTMSVATLLSGSRTGTLGLALGVLALACVYGIRRARRATMLGGAVVVLAALAGVAYLGAAPMLHKLMTLLNPNRESAFSTRAALAKDTLRMIRDHPLTGTGLGTYPLIIPQYLSWYTDVGWDKAHNDYLQLAAETGVTGLVLALWWIASFFRRMLREIARRRPLPPLQVGAACGCLALLFHSMVDFNLQITANALFFAVLAALAVRSGRSGEHASE
jgi:O-antigen ligase